MLRGRDERFHPGQDSCQRGAASSTGAAYANPGIATTGSSVVITAIDTTPGNVMYWSQAFGAIPWHQERVAAG